MKKVQVGTVSSLYLYPVKSMQGIPVTQAEFFWYGFMGDRNCAFVRSDNGSNFPWLTGRQIAQLVQYQPYFVQPDDPFGSAIRVVTPTGKDMALEDQALQAELADIYDNPVHLMKLNRGTFDCMPVSVMSLNTIQAFDAQVDSTLEARRFRPNILIDTAQSDIEFPEDRWLDQGLIFGDQQEMPHLKVNYRIKRCAMINIDPDTAERNPSVLRTVAQTRDSRAGVYCAVNQLGTIQVGDAVYLTEEA